MGDQANGDEEDAAPTGILIGMSRLSLSAIGVIPSGH